MAVINPQPLAAQRLKHLTHGIAQDPNVPVRHRKAFHINLRALKFSTAPAGGIPESFAIRVNIVQVPHQLLAMRGPRIVVFIACRGCLMHQLVPQPKKAMPLNVGKLASALRVLDYSMLDGELDRVATQEKQG